jgi:hypothetical protein
MNRRVTFGDVDRAFRKAVRRAVQRNRIQGLMGKPLTASTWAFDVPGGRGWKYVRIVAANGESASTTQALNAAGVSDTGDLPIWLDTDTEGNLTIVGQRFEGT